VKPLSGAEVARAGTLACLVEAAVAKPGNVSPAAAFADTTYEDFVASAETIGPALAAAGRAGVGETVLRAVRETRARVATNTNLGIVLLLAPLARAAAGDGAAQGLRRAVARVLRELTVEDARLAYEAIRVASPGGMGQVDRHDVAEAAVDVTLREVMLQAAGRDSVAREYATDFEVTFTLGVPALHAAWGGGAGARVGTATGAVAGTVLAEAVLDCFLTILAEVPDTLIARKRGLDVARRVSERASEVRAVLRTESPVGPSTLAAFDAELRDPGHTLNPGTTADLVTASLFVLLTEAGMRDRVAKEAERLSRRAGRDGEGSAPGAGEGLSG
jgi:triphosphoribosyl-dephospho-CoA synthase